MQTCLACSCQLRRKLANNLMLSQRPVAKDLHPNMIGLSTA